MNATDDVPVFNDQVEEIPESEHYIVRHRKIILFLSLIFCLAGAYAAHRMPASVFPQTDFPRVVILVDNGVMPADEMMATITRNANLVLIARQFVWMELFTQRIYAQLGNDLLERLEP